MGWKVKEKGERGEKGKGEKGEGGKRRKKGKGEERVWVVEGVGKSYGGFRGEVGRDWGVGVLFGGMKLFRRKSRVQRTS